MDPTLGVIGGIASGLGSLFGANATAKAAKEAAALQQKRYEESKALATPYIQGGTNALNIYNDAVGVNGADAQKSYYGNFQNDPGFQASVDYGTGQVAAKAAAQGQGLSGNTLAALQDYSQKNLLDEFHDRLDRLYKEVGTGASAVNALSGVGNSSAATQGNFENAAGASEGKGISQVGNTVNSTLYGYDQATNGVKPKTDTTTQNNLNAYYGDLWK